MSKSDPRAIGMIIEDRIALLIRAIGARHIGTGTVSAGSEVPIEAMPYGRQGNHVQIRRHTFEGNVWPLRKGERAYCTFLVPRRVHVDHLLARIGNPLRRQLRVEDGKTS